MSNETGAQPTAIPALPMRWVQVFVAPSALFDRLKERPAWFWAAVLGGVMVLIGVFAIPTEIWEEFFRAQLLATGQEVPPELSGSGTVMRIFGAIGGTVFWFVWVFGISAVVAGIFAFVLGDEVGYRLVLAGASHALLIAATGSLLTLPLKIAQRDPQLTLSVGTFIPIEDGYLAAFLGSLDLFSIWAFVVLGIAMSRFDRRRSVGSAVAILMVLFVGLMSVLSIFQA